MTKGHLENVSRHANADSGHQVHLDKDGGGSSRQSWMELSGLWPCLTGNDKASVSQVK